MKKGIIYKVTNTVNGKIYIGKTIQTLEKRIIAHRTVSKRSNAYFHNALKKYGESSFIWEVLNIVDRDNLDKLERDYIIKFKTREKEFGYNLTDGGDGCLGYKCTEQQIQKRRNAANVRWSKPGERERYSKHMKEIVKNNPKYQESIKKAHIASLNRNKNLVKNI